MTNETTPTPTSNQGTERRAVRDQYAEIATSEERCCGAPSDSDTERTRRLGYGETALESAPTGSNLGLGCGNPVAIASLETGDRVLDLGSGGGFDCFLAAAEVGPEGRVIGVDMTPEMLERARDNAEKSEHDHVEFRLGEIEHLPVADEAVDVVISNCVLTHSPAKPQVLAESYRVLAPGGRLSISDLVADGPATGDVPAANCGNPATPAELQQWLTDVGFADVTVTLESEWQEGISSARLEGRKPE